MSQEIPLARVKKINFRKLFEFVAFVAFAIYLLTSMQGENPVNTSQLPEYAREYSTLQSTLQLAYAEEPFPSELYEKVTVTRIVDGDTIRVLRENGEDAAVRYIGIDTPEIDRSEAQNHDAFALEALKLNEYLVNNKSVYLQADAQDVDKYGRLLRYVYTEDGVLVNYAIIRLGLAHLMTIPPNVAYQPLFFEAQQLAITERLRLFQAY